MKTKLFALLGALIALTLLIGAATPATYTQKSDTQWRHQVDSSIDPKNGELTAWTITAFFQAQFVNNANPADVFSKQLGSVTLDCVKDAEKAVTYTFNGKKLTLTYGEIAAATAAAAAQEWAGNPKKGR